MVALELEAAAEHLAAAEAYALAGDTEGEIRALTSAGAIDRLEERLTHDADSSKRSNDRTLALRRIQDLDRGAERRRALETALQLGTAAGEQDDRIADLVRDIRQRLVRGPLCELVVRPGQDRGARRGGDGRARRRDDRRDLARAQPRAPAPVPRRGRPDRGRGRWHAQRHVPSRRAARRRDPGRRWPGAEPGRGGALRAAAGRFGRRLDRGRWRELRGAARRVARRTVPCPARGQGRRRPLVRGAAERSEAPAYIAALALAREVELCYGDAIAARRAGEPIVVVGRLERA